MRSTVAYERAGSVRSERVRPLGWLTRLVTGTRGILAAIAEEILRIPDYANEAESIEARLRRAQSRRQHRS